MISISGLHEFRGRLDALDIDLAIGHGLRAAADHVAERVRESLATPPGGPHARPWLRTGALRESVHARVVEGGAVIGSDSDVALAQELGTRSIPPRPFLAPAALAEADAAAGLIADTIAAALRNGQHIT